VQVPEPVSHLRVRGWLPSPQAEEGRVTALLDIRPEDPVPETAALVEVYRVVVRLVFPDATSSVEELCTITQVMAPAQTTATSARVEGLKPGWHVELEVFAENAVGKSSPVSIRIVVPTEAGASVSAVPLISPRLSTALSTGIADPAATKESNPPTPTKTTPRTSLSDGVRAQNTTLELDLEKRRQSLEQWWQERQKEAERADAQRAKDMAEFRAQREALQKEREEWERTRSEAPPSPHSSFSQSPLLSPRCPADIQLDDLELEPAVEELKADQVQLDGVRAARDELQHEWEEIQRLRVKQREEAEQAATERERWAQLALAQQQELEHRLEQIRTMSTATASGVSAQKTASANAEGSEELAELQAELARQREKLKHQREEQHLEAARASEEAARLAAEAQRRRVEVDERTAEVRALEAARDAVVESSEADQKRAQEELRVERQELIRQRYEQREQAAASEAAVAARARALEEQQAQLDDQRRAMERAAADSDLSREQALLADRRAELEKERTAEEEMRKSQVEQLNKAEHELRRRAENLARAEEQLVRERRELAQSRASLAVVQAHVVSMLDKADPSGQVSEHRMDTVDGGDTPVATLDHVWSMDWTKANLGSVDEEDL